MVRRKKYMEAPSPRSSSNYQTRKMQRPEEARTLNIMLLISSTVHLIVVVVYYHTIGGS